MRSLPDKESELLENAAEQRLHPCIHDYEWVGPDEQDWRCGRCNRWWPNFREAAGKPQTISGRQLAAFLRGLFPETDQFERQIFGVEEEARTGFDVKLLAEAMSRTAGGPWESDYSDRVAAEYDRLESKS